MPLTNNIVVLDLETGGLSNDCEILELACVVIDRQDLSIIKGSEFRSLARPKRPADVQAQALAVNGLKMDDLMRAPEMDVVWPMWANHIKSYRKKGPGIHGRPIPAGKNIRNFDLPILSRYSRDFGTADKDGLPNFLYKRIQLELEDDLYRWLLWEMPDLKMDTFRDYVGMSREGSHSALVDTTQTAQALIHFLKLYQQLLSKVKFKEAFAGN